MRDAVYVVKMSLNVIPKVNEALATNGAYDIIAKV
jgi:hypothetical protein